ncbi:jg17617, partial [Pararge aegeria aegeria]
RSKASLSIRSLEIVPGQKKNTTSLAYRCDRCRLLSVMVRMADNNIYNLDTSRYRIREADSQQYLELEVEGTKPQDFGDYFAIIQNKDGIEERVKMLSVLSPGNFYDKNIKATMIVEDWKN